MPRPWKRDHPSSIWNDTPVSYNRGNGEDWTPLNYGREQQGDLTLRQALAYSNNVIAVKVLEAVGVPAFVDFCREDGAIVAQPNDLSLALGTDEVTLNDLVVAYSPLATGGSRPEPRTIIRIYDRARKPGRKPLRQSPRPFPRPPPLSPPRY